MADKPCNTCANYDPIIRGKGNRVGKHGWCVAKSVYPVEDTPGRQAPAGAKRVEEGRAKPYIVMGAKIEKNCMTFRPLPPAKKK